MLPPQATALTGPIKSMVNAYVSLRASVVDLSFRRSICSKSMRKSSSSTSSGACITCKLTTSKHNLPMGLIDDGDDWHNDHIWLQSHGPMVRWSEPTVPPAQLWPARLFLHPALEPAKSRWGVNNWNDNVYARLYTVNACQYFLKSDRQANVYIYIYRYIEAGRTGFPWFSTFSAALAGPNWWRAWTPHPVLLLRRLGLSTAEGQEHVMCTPITTQIWQCVKTLYPWRTSK